jgi:glycosyltransferase involved in cell wall biosynthesis/ADP-heptose:LPS heptosyltransferase/2-polyprenyl-3-methyl-5-hydroxy-6-metoxy-1,4-benzoquinol methylase
MKTSSHYGIAIFHGIGDILNCTPIAKQLKINEPDCYITWYTAAKYRFIIENNPFIDEIITLEGDVLALDKEIPRLRLERNWTRFFTPAPYMNYDVLPGGSLLDLIKVAAGLNWTIPFIPTFSLTDDEKAKATSYWQTLPEGKKILVETEFYSEQSHWKDDYAFQMLDELRSIDPVFVFTSKNKPPFFDEFHQKYRKSVWCAEPFRLNAEFFNLSDVFIGVSSGISCVTFSDYCRTDIPRIEVSRGEHWSAAGYSHLSELYICYHRKRFRESLRSLCIRLSGNAVEPDFSARFSPLGSLSNSKERVPCLVCGSRQSIAVRGDDIVKCNDCGFQYLRDRMTTKAMEEYYTNVYAVNNPQAAPMVRVPPSKQAVDTIEEFISSQRKALFNQAVIAYGKNIRGGTLIDIGCGWGALLHNAKREGMNCIGFEFTAPNVEFGRNVLGLDIRQQQFIDADIAENSVDIITMSHVLEHVPLPFEFLQKIEYVLKPDGIFTCVVPNFGSLCSEAMREQWSWLEREWHYSQFTPNVLREMFAQAGFFVEHCTTATGDFGTEIPLAVLKHIQPNATIQQLADAIEKINLSGMGEEIRIIGRKRGSSKHRYQPKGKNILWVRTDSIGDASLSASMLPYIREKYENCTITILCQNHLREFYAASPFADIVIGFDKDRAYREEQYRNQIALQLQQMNIDIALNSVYSREPLTDFFTLATGATTTIALDGGLDNMSKEVLYQNNKQYSLIIKSAADYKPELERHKDFLQGLEIDVDILLPKIWLTEEDELFAEKFFREHNLSTETTIGLFAGVQIDIRRYEHFGEALAPLCTKNNLTVLGFGAENERDFVQKQLDETGARTINICGKTTIRQVAALLKKCALGVGSETGSAHLACAVGTRNVVLLGGGHFGRFMPYSPLTSVVALPLECYGCNWQCRYQTPHCVRSVSSTILSEAIIRTYQTEAAKPRIFIQEPTEWKPKKSEPQWAWFYHYIKPSDCEVIRVIGKPIEANNQPQENEILVTAIVSTYNSEKFIRGCLEDLVNQTLYQKGKLEILVIDACSKEKESAIVEEFQSRYTNIRYERREKREPLYTSWNYACTIARGIYCANTNADDRRREDCLEKLADALENSGKGIAYSDLSFGKKENEPYHTASIGVWRFPDFDPKLAVLYNLGCFTILWRKTAWEQNGGFNEKYKLAADFDFFTRVGLKFGAAHVPEPLTMALLHDGQQSKKEEQMNIESQAIRDGFLKLPLSTIFPGTDLSTYGKRAAAYISIGNTAMTLREPWYGDQIVPKVISAALWYQLAITEQLDNPVALYNLALVNAVAGQKIIADRMLFKRRQEKTITEEEFAIADNFIQQAVTKVTQELLKKIPLKEMVLRNYPQKYIPPHTGKNISILFTMYGWKESGGGTTFPRSVAKRLVTLGFDVTVFYAAGNHPTQSSPYYLEYTLEDGVRLFGLYNRPTIFLDAENPLREIEDAECVRIFKKIADECQPEVVHYHNFLGLSFAIADEVYSRKVPSVYTPHNYHLIDPTLYLFRSDLSLWHGTDFLENSELAAHSKKRGEYFRREQKARELLCEKINYTLAVSRRQRDILADFTGDDSRLTVVNQVPESAVISDTIPNKRNLKLPLRFGFIGGVMPHKGVHILVQAAQVAEPSEVEIHIYGFGNTDYINALKSLDQKGVLCFHGQYNSEDLPTIAGGLDAIILPSVWEDCAPLVIAEALALHLPVIAANIGGFSDFITDRVNGRLYRYDSVEELSHILKELIRNPEQLETWSNNATLPYSFDNYAQFMANLYTKLAYNKRLEEKDILLTIKEQIEPEIHSQQSEHPMTSEPLNRVQFSENLRGGFSNNDARGQLPETLPSPLYLNLGCGRDVRDGFINIDLFSDDERVVRMDIRKLQLDDNVADGILASDVLEHFSHRETDIILAEWARVLKPNGEIIIRCPSLRLQIQAYQRGIWDADIASYMIFGGQTNPGDYHCIGFDEQSIRKHLEKAGFEVLSFEEVDTPQTSGFINLNMTVQARKKAVEILQPKIELAPRDEATPRRSGSPAINLIWEGSQFVWHSFALINREQCANIIQSGVAEVTIIPYEPDQFSPIGDKKYELLAAHDIRFKIDVNKETKKLPYIWVRHQWPPKTEEPKGALWIIQQPWEFSALRKDFVELFNQADEIWTPSNYSRNAFIASGVESNKVQIVPNGINPELFTPSGNRQEFATNKRFKFLFVGGTILRKGIDILLKSFATTFTADDDVCLIIKDMGGDSFYKGQTAKAMIDQVRRLDGAPEILYTDTMMSEEEMAELYRSCDVFVSPYRGEGFSLPALEAMASGLSVIVTDGGATDDFADETVGWLIPAGKRSIGTVISGHELTEEGFLLEPDGTELSEILRYCYAHPTECFHKGIAASQRARTNWTWKRATLKTLSRLDTLCNTSMAIEAEITLHDKEDGTIAIANAEQSFAHGDVDTAIPLYQAAIMMGGLPTRYNLLAIQRLAWISAADGDVELAREFIEKADNILKYHPDSLYIKSLCFALESKWVDSLELLNQLLHNWKSYRFDVSLGITLDQLLTESARAMLELGDLEQAHQIYEQALKLNPENADACYGVALCFLEAGLHHEAKTMFDWAVRLNPEYEEVAGDFE